jgi:membrane-bound lytic murein transglycosylase A
MAAFMIEASAPPKAAIEPRDFAHLPGWDEDDHGEAFQALRRSAAVAGGRPPKTRGVEAEALVAILARARALPADLPGGQARTFFETEFQPFEILPIDGAGFFTGYYEPIVAGSRTRTARFNVPLYRAPDDLVEFDPDRPPPGIDPSLRFARKTATGLVPYCDRAQIEAGALAGRGLELVYLADPVDAFFVHIQGAARIALADGGTLRLTYAAKSGHPYTAIGKVLIENGELEPGKATMAGIRAWLAENPERAAAVMARNRSFIFFREAPVDDAELGPVAAAKVPLTSGRSLAVDRLLHTFHTPVWVDTTLPGGSTFRHLTIAQDTGSAIIGPARGDIFFGAGEQAGQIAGDMASTGRFVLLVPRRSRSPGTLWS